MPKEVSDIKQFIEICRRKDATCTLNQPLLPPSSPLPPLQSRRTSFPILSHFAKPKKKKKSNPFQRMKSVLLTIFVWKTAARIKRNRKTQQIKFKVRCHRFLYTLVLKDSDKADKLKQSLPPSTIPFLFSEKGYFPKNCFFFFFHINHSADALCDCI